ncbi:MAG: UDP-3-O-(3-hydroxymyristoyl)glucosamine N-acyltransferase [Bacteroidales bacterium]|jgi:UDP-3-O-[3-hydroxymyristoyl] glucosamine N-acyltransferase|nr:UDP-3-O-(3-hydroxymyristoyl)glucosamine N-acyltransferase [Bacteroidales bacterium]
MEFTAQLIADFIKGEIAGDANVTVSSFAKIEEGRPGSLSFLANPKYEKYLYETASSIVIVNKAQKITNSVNATLIKVDDAYMAFASLLELYHSSLPEKTGREEPVSVAASAQLGKDVFLGAFSCIGENACIGDGVKIHPQVYIGENVRIGDRTVLYPGVKVYRGCVIGSDCVLHAGVVIGADGFGFAPQTGADFKKIPQIGNAVIEDRVEIGANTCIDRATMGSTIIRRGVKLDNLIQVGHNVEIGENTVIASQTGISGSTKVGANCMLAGQVGLAGHLTIADGTKIGAQSGLNSSVTEPESTIMGTPAFGYKDWLRSSIIFKQLPNMKRKIDELDKKLNEKTDG